MKTLTDSLSGVFKAPVDGGSTYETRLKYTHVSPPSVTRAQKGGVNDCDSKDEVMRTKRSATVDIRTEERSHRGRRE